MSNLPTYRSYSDFPPKPIKKNPAMAGREPLADKEGRTISTATSSAALKAAVALNFFLAFGWMQSQGMCGGHKASLNEGELATRLANGGGQPLRMSPEVFPTVSPSRV